MRTHIKSLVNGVLAGMMISLGATAYLAVENVVVGALLFSTGLFMIVTHGYSLYTGKICAVPNEKPVYLLECLESLIGNCIGTFIFAKLFLLTRVGYALSGRAFSIMEKKIIEYSRHDEFKVTHSSWIDCLITAFILAVFCGLLVYLAVYTYRVQMEKNNGFGAVCGVYFCIGIFIICGFNHCIADMYYFFLGGSNEKGGEIHYFIAIILGNSVGGMFIPCLKRFNIC